MKKILQIGATLINDGAMMTERDYYQVLQISPQADPAIVKAAYYTLLKTLRKHPDLGGDHEDALLLNEAYEVLGDPERRREYDREFMEGLVSEASAPQTNPFAPEQCVRQYARAVFQNHFTLRRPFEDQWNEAQFRDISFGGACFRSKIQLKKGDSIEINLSDDLDLRATGKIRWGRMLPQRFGRPLFEGGFEFEKINRKALERFLKLVGLESILFARAG